MEERSWENHLNCLERLSDRHGEKVMGEAFEMFEKAICDTGEELFLGTCNSRGVGGVGVLVNTSLSTNIDSFEQLTARIGRLPPISSYEKVDYFCMDYMELETFYKEDHTFFNVVVAKFNARNELRRTTEERHSETNGLEWNEQGFNFDMMTRRDVCVLFCTSEKVDIMPRLKTALLTNAPFVVAVVCNTAVDENDNPLALEKSEYILQKPNYRLHVEAHDSGESAQRPMVTAVIDGNNIYGNAPEGVMSGHSILTLSITDADGTSFGSPFRIDVRGEGSKAFTADEQYNRVTVTRLDHSNRRDRFPLPAN
ncbi:unnamed protein product [Angiostrongylus costaricensis]|uniref:Cadherin domain-containing protein n=1 Tax=Angiostrongylus costaricensis TaxID=334426 RepID=A0A158PEW6_ANGCS|nr:unnamed protein product [Angiostrongylus costaricensis]